MKSSTSSSSSSGRGEREELCLRCGKAELFSEEDLVTGICADCWIESDYEHEEDSPPFIHGTSSFFDFKKQQQQQHKNRHRG